MQCGLYSISYICKEYSNFLPRIFLGSILGLVLFLVSVHYMIYQMMNCSHYYLRLARNASGLYCEDLNIKEVITVQSSHCTKDVNWCHKIGNESSPCTVPIIMLHHVLIWYSFCGEQRQMEQTLISPWRHLHTCTDSINNQEVLAWSLVA